MTKNEKLDTLARAIGQISDHLENESDLHFYTRSRDTVYRKIVHFLHECMRTGSMEDSKFDAVVGQFQALCALVHSSPGRRYEAPVGDWLKQHQKYNTFIQKDDS